MQLKQFSPKWLLAGVLFALPLCAQATPQSLDNVIAIVNKNVILQSELDQLIHKIQIDAAEQNQSLPPYHQLHKQVLDRLIEDSLILQQAERQGLRIGDTQLDQALASVAADKGQSVASMQAQAQREGLTPAEFRETVRKEMLISEVRRNQLRQRINITDQEVKQLSKLISDQGSKGQRFHIEHILLSLPTDADRAEQQRVAEKAKQLLAQLKKGADFHQIAVAESADNKALDGGDWGWMTVEEMPSLMAEAVSGAHKDQFIGPLRSGAGLHIIHVKDVQGQQAIELQEANARHILIKTSVILSDEKAEQMLKGFLHDIQSGKASFAKLAEKYSDDTGSATKGGELGWANPEMYVPEFRDMVKTLPIGQFSQPFKTVHGWHIVQVEGRRSLANTPEALENRAYQLIYNRRFAEEAQTWSDELRDEAFIQIMDGSNK
jgi:peptidyl-prolyl cis-trans isomerase SurA